MFVLIVLTLVLAAFTLLNQAKPSLINSSVATSLFERANVIEGQNPR